MSTKQLPNPEWVEITPDLAALYLSANVDYNRPRDARKVKEWADKMRRGAWQRTGATIDFDETGALINGQHRLQAIIDSGLTQEFIVVNGLPKEAFDHTDIGAARSTAMVFGRYFPEETNKNAKVAIARFGLIGVLNASATPDKDTVVQFAKEMLPFINLVLEPLMALPAPFRRAPMVAAFLNAMRRDDEFAGAKGQYTTDQVMPLVKRYAQQMWKGPHDPMKVLFDRIQRSALSKSAGENMSPHDMYALGVSALRSALRGDASLRRLYATTVDWGEVESKVKRPRKTEVANEE